MPDTPRVLLPIEILEGDGIPEGVPELLAHGHVVLLGYHVLPEQTAPGQARMQFEEQAKARLDGLTEIFEAAGASVDTVLVFTQDAQQTIDRVIYEEECLAVLVPGTIGTVDEVFVPVRGNVGVDRLVQLLTGLFTGMDVRITLFHIASEEETDGDAEILVDGIRTKLADNGVDAERIASRIERANLSVERIIEAASDYDVVVLGETTPSVMTYVFGMGSDQIADRFLGPVLVVQRERSEE